MLNGSAVLGLKPEVMPIDGVQFCETPTLELLAAGKYDFVSAGLERGITSLPAMRLPRNKDLKIQMLNFGVLMSSEQVCQDLLQMKLRPLTVHELLAIGAQLPDLQKMFLIVALGTSFSTVRCERFAFLWGSSAPGSSLRYLCLNAATFLWPSYARFAAVTVA